MGTRFSSTDEVAERLEATGYLPDPATAMVCYLADRLDKPILAEGPAGVGKTALSYALSQATSARLLRLQCYEGLDETKALYEWNYKKQLLRIQADQGPDHATSWQELQTDLFTEQFLLERPLLAAIRSSEPVVLLVDEVDRVEVETEALLLEVLGDFQVSIPELGTISATRLPMVVLTSNATRELSEALRRRCLYLPVEYPSLDRERQIVRARVPDLDESLAGQVARVVGWLRGLELKKPPSVSESIDWARTLVVLGAHTLDEATIQQTLQVVLKHQRDLERARAQLGGRAR